MDNFFICGGFYSLGITVVNAFYVNKTTKRTQRQKKKLAAITTYLISCSKRPVFQHHRIKYQLVCGFSRQQMLLAKIKRVQIYHVHSQALSVFTLFLHVSFANKGNIDHTYGSAAFVACAMQNVVCGTRGMLQHSFVEDIQPAGSGISTLLLLLFLWTQAIRLARNLIGTKQTICLAANHSIDPPCSPTRFTTAMSTCLLQLLLPTQILCIRYVYYNLATTNKAGFGCCALWLLWLAAGLRCCSCCCSLQRPTLKVQPKHEITYSAKQKNKNETKK